MPNTFKKFDYVKSNNHVRRVAFTTGPYVHFFGGDYIHFANCTLVEPKFKPGDVVHNGNRYFERTIDRVKTEYGPGDVYTGPIAYDYVGGMWDMESSLTLIRRAPTMESIRALASSGKKIEAIKEYRVLHGVGLVEAKNAVEAMGDEVRNSDAAKPKFRVGDVVRHSYGGLYTVSDVRPSDGYLFFKDYSAAGYNPPRCFTLHKSAETPHIVAVFENGKYRPSSDPHIHATREMAVAEAERLSRKHPGVKFGTFALVADSETPETVVTTRTLGETQTVSR